MRVWASFTRMVVMSSLREKISLFFMFAFSLIFVFSFGYIFGRNDPGRMRFVAAQLFTLTVVANSLFGLGNLALMVRQKGVLRRLYTAPVSKHTVLLGILAAWFVISSLTFGAMLAVLELVFRAGLAGQGLLLWGLYLLGTTAFAGVAFVLAGIANRPEGVVMGANALFFPMLFLSGLSIPSFLLPDLAQRLGQTLPAYALFEFFQSVTGGRPIGGMAVVYGTTLLLMGVGGYIAAVVVYRWDPEQRLSRVQQFQLVGALLVLLFIPWAGTAAGRSIQQVRQWWAPRYILQVGHAFDGERILPASPVYIGIQEDRVAFVSEAVPQSWRHVAVRDFGGDAWVIPGMVDLHVHLESPVVWTGWNLSIDNDERMRHDLVAGYVGSGVTTVRSFGDDYEWLRDTRRVADAGLARYPHLLIAGPIFTAPGGHPLELPIFRLMSEEQRSQRVIEVDTPEQAREALRTLLRKFRPDWVKAVYDSGDPRMFRTLPRLRRDTLEALIVEAHREGLRVTVHVSKVEELRDVVEAGADMIEHIPTDAPIDDTTLAEMKHRGTVVCPTVFVIEGPRRRYTGERIADDFIRQRLMPNLREQLQTGGDWFDWMEFVPEVYRAFVRGEMMARTDRVVQTAYENVRRLARAGVPIVAGSDAGNPNVYHGPGLIHELEALVRAGLRPEEALRAATGTAAQVLSIPSGRLAPGRVADLVIVGRNPTADVTHLRTIRVVILRGRLFTVDALLR